MKKIFLFVLMIALHLNSIAAGWNKAMLRLKEDRGRAISITIDGKRFNKIGRTVTVNDLAPGRHMIKIYRYNSNGYGYQNGLLIYQGEIKVNPGHIYYCTVSRNAMDIEENCCIDNYGNWNNNDNWENWDEGEHNWNNNTQWNQHNQNNYEENTWNDYNGGMSNGRFQQLIDQIRKASFESSKVSVAKQALRNNNISVDQLKSILNEFSFESTKLQFAKDNYSKVINKRDFFLINDVFTFQSSKDDLNQFLERQQR
jgi:hypothetical protein